MDHLQQQPDPAQHAQQAPQAQHGQQPGYFDQAIPHQMSTGQYAQQPALVPGQPAGFAQGSQSGSQYGPPHDQYQQPALDPNIHYQQAPQGADQPDPQYVGQTASQAGPQMYQQAPAQQAQYVDPQAYQQDPQQPQQQGQYIPQPGLDPQGQQYIPQPAPAQQQYFAPQPGQPMPPGQWQHAPQGAPSVAGSHRSRNAGTQHGGLQTASQASGVSSVSSRHSSQAASVASSRAPTITPGHAAASQASHRSHRSHRSQAPQQYAGQPQVPPQAARSPQTPSQGGGYPRAASQATGYSQSIPQAPSYAQAPPHAAGHAQSPPPQDPRHVHFRQPSASIIPPAQPVSQTFQQAHFPTPRAANPPNGLSPAQRAALREQDIQAAHARITSLQAAREAADLQLAHKQSLRHAENPDDAMIRRVMQLSLQDYTAQFGADEEAQVAEALRRSQGDAPDMDDEELRQQIHVAQMRSLEELAERLQRRVRDVDSVEAAGGTSRVGGSSRHGGSSRRHGESHRRGGGDADAQSARSASSTASTVRDQPRHHRGERAQHRPSPLAHEVPQSDTDTIRSWAPRPVFQDPPLASPPALPSYDPPMPTPSHAGVPPPRPLTPTPPVSLDAAQQARNVEEAERTRRFAEHAQRYGGPGQDANEPAEGGSVYGSAYDIRTVLPGQSSRGGNVGN